MFRGIHDTKTLTSDFAGMKNGRNSFCLHKNYNVFFYPFPFVTQTVSKYKHIVMFMTTRDLTLVNLILPSKFYRGNRHDSTGGIVSCDSLEYKCGQTGRSYDPCIDYSKVSESIDGMLAIAAEDASELKSSFESYSSYLNYFRTYKDSGKNIGVPEIVLHPRMDKSDITETITDFGTWYKSNKNSFNYIYLHVMSSNNVQIKKLMNEFMSESGLDLGDDMPYHLKVNKKTGFFQIDEFSDNQSELVSFGSSVRSTQFKEKPVIKGIKDTYPLADTVPGQLTLYFTIDGTIHLKPEEMEYLKRFSSNTMNNSMRIETRDKKFKNEIRVFKINNKFYALDLTDKGLSMMNEYKDSPNQTISDKPINYEASFYEATRNILSNKPIQFKYTLSDTPARDINGLLQHHAQKKGLLGASRRRTLRRSRLLKAR